LVEGDIMVDMSGVTMANTSIDLIIGLDQAIQSEVGFQLLGPLLLLTIFVIILFRMLRSNPVPESVLTSSVVAMLAGFVLVWMGWMDQKWLLLIGIGIIWPAFMLYRGG
jgi:uncharacterized membrane protein YcgQ (UPF0703/DUF1980 family)